MRIQNTPATELFGAQLPALCVAVQLAAGYPELPGAYVVQSRIYPDQVDMQIQNASDLLTWRQALRVDEATVADSPIQQSDVLREWRTTVDGTSVRFYTIVSAAEAEAVPA
ncbi:hypothetical protein [Streptomyces sp. NPDC096153]|uniref:hypothetical protein n=1 Tax=Streptomyces sp. NPDC096153 TaxID=3155548 RepID=UPI003333BDD9